MSAGQYSTYAFTTTPENFITGITEASDTSAVYPWALSQTASYNTLNQLTDLSGQTLTWDADGNLTSDGTRTYTWDAENRLVGVAYPGEPGKATSFAYDGLGRRVAITSTPAGGGSSVTTSYLWCGSVLCQARDAGNATTREYLAEGEYVPGVTPETDYYGIDQIGTVRRVFASPSSAAAFSYDPYGVPLQVTAPTTDFTYAGMFHNADSGLDLTLYRAYDPIAGRWLSRDPLGEASSPLGNLYPYVDGNPLSWRDALGLCPPGAPDCIEPVYPDLWAIGAFAGGSETAALLRLGIKAFTDTTGLPPQGVKPPVESPDLCVTGPASNRPGQSLWDTLGGEWRYHGEDTWHNPHWDYNRICILDISANDS